MGVGGGSRDSEIMRGWSFERDVGSRHGIRDLLREECGGQSKAEAFAGTRAAFYENAVWTPLGGARQSDGHEQVLRRPLVLQMAQPT